MREEAALTPHHQRSHIGFYYSFDVVCVSTAFVPRGCNQTVFSVCFFLVWTHWFLTCWLIAFAALEHETFDENLTL